MANGASAKTATRTVRGGSGAETGGEGTGGGDRAGPAGPEGPGDAGAPGRAEAAESVRNSATALANRGEGPILAGSRSCLPRRTRLVEPSVLPGDVSECLIAASPPQCSWLASR
jgi:hypothetical protein